MNKQTLITIAVGIVLLVALAASSAESPQQPSGDRIAAFEMTWAAANPEAIQARTRAAVEAFTGQGLKRVPIIETLKTGAGVQNRISVRVPEAPNLDIEYLRDVDELRIQDTELAVSTAPKSELSRDAALRVARKLFDQLAARKVIDARHFDWEKVDVASTFVGGGPSDGKNTEKERTEYRFTLRRLLNGIEIANSGLRIAVHASGRVSSLRLGGVTVRSAVAPSGIEQPIGTGRWLDKGAIGDPAARLEREFKPKGAKLKIAWSRVMYVMPEDKRRATVEPLYVVSYSLEFPSDGDTTVISRRQTVGFSLVDPKRAPINLTPPVRQPVLELERTKKPYSPSRQNP